MGGSRFHAFGGSGEDAPNHDHSNPNRVAEVESGTARNEQVKKHFLTGGELRRERGKRIVEERGERRENLQKDNANDRTIIRRGPTHVNNGQENHDTEMEVEGAEGAMAIEEPKPPDIEMGHSGDTAEGPNGILRTTRMQEDQLMNTGPNWIEETKDKPTSDLVEFVEESEMDMVA
ncbi:hypothetical protein PIB30_099146 [Stylosanthes scabra]|uniref:Uncharacterized protein n=1 Tax=Stylosanthes scabra TaxID=79078 RepID=A0ABU6UVR0_9FABA|nr:hypothetical protein [Stylosanthes scabra]